MPRFHVLVLIVLGLAGCHGAADLAGLDGTGLRGVVLRGPMQPVCQEGQPCDDDPFAATFNVYDGRRRVATFRSGEDGRFEVGLQPGPYTVVPGPDAPIMSPESQGQDVLVAPHGMTEVELHFDTGIR